MKTIQKVLSELDKDEVIDYYFSTYPVDIFKDLGHDWDAKTVAECKDYGRNKLRSLIERIVSAKANPSIDKKSILFVYKCIGNGFYDGIVVSLLDARELLDSEEFSHVQSYAYEFEKLEDTVGYYVSDTPLTQNNILDVVTSYLYEVSFFGYEQEHLEEERQILEEAIKEIKEHPENLEEIDIQKFNEEILSEKYPEEDEKLEAYHRAVAEYADYCKGIELDRIKTSLLADADSKY